MVQDAILELVAKTMEKCVMSTLESYIITTTFFNLWMSKSGHDIFALVINFINSHWVPCHVTVGFFLVIDTSKVAMVTQVKELLPSYNLLDKLIAYMKDKGGNLFTLAKALNSVVSYVPLKLATPWQGSRFGHDFSKACQYAYNDATLCLSFWKVKRACLDASLHNKKLKTPMKTRFANKGYFIPRDLGI